MKIAWFGSRALGIGLAVALLAGCGSQANSPMPLGNAAIGQAKAHKMSASSGDLLYVSNQEANSNHGVVYVFAYPSGSLSGTLTGFVNPAALCADQSGDVFVPDTGAADIVEYAHGGTIPIQTLQASGKPTACAVDRTTGDLAVSNLDGSVSIYKNATGNPKSYSVSFPAVFCGYDNDGNLFVTGQARYGDTLVAELPSGGDSFESVSLKKNVGKYSLAGLQWHGRYLVLARQGPGQYDCCGKLYRYAIHNQIGTRVWGRYTGSLIANFFIYASTLITTINEKVYLTSFPKLNRSRFFKSPGINSYGVVVSVAPPHK